MIDPRQLLIGIGCALAIAVAAHRVHALSTSGAIATAILGAVIFGLGGPMWSLPLITFFILSSLLSRVGSRGPRSKERFDTVFEKGSRRDAGQVIANGGVAGVIALAAAFGDPGARHGFFLAYLGSLAAATADTWGTEIGVLGRGRVVSLVTLRPVPAGTSGGVSLAGSLGAAAGALSVSLSVLPWEMDPFRIIIIGVAAGVMGMVIDSAAGALVQARYRCEVCGSRTERRMHCDRPSTLESGYRWVTNDVVNIICCASGAAAAWLLWLLV